jgi:hypothetical protein
MEHRWILAVEHRKGAQNEIRYSVFPAVTGDSFIRLRRRRFLQAPQEPFDDSPSHGDSIASFLNSELLLNHQQFRIQDFLTQKKLKKVRFGSLYPINRLLFYITFIDLDQFFLEFGIAGARSTPLE